MGRKSAMTKQTTGSVPTQAVWTGFLNKTVAVDRTAYPYVVYVPHDYSSAKQWPVILFLHGSGEIGSDGLKQTQGGLGSAIRLRPERYPAIVVMPQCAHEPNDWAGKMIAFALKALDQ